MGSLGRLDTGSTPHTPTPGSQTSASACLPWAHLPRGPGLPDTHPEMIRRGSQQPPPNTLPYQTPGFPMVGLCCPRMGCSRKVAENTPTPRRAQQVFQVCPSDTTTKKFLAIMTVYNQDTSPGWHPNTFSGTPFPHPATLGTNKLSVSRLFTLF